MTQLKQKHVDTSHFQDWMFAKILKCVSDIIHHKVGHISYV